VGDLKGPVFGVAGKNRSFVKLRRASNRTAARKTEGVVKDRNVEPSADTEGAKRVGPPPNNGAVGNKDTRAVKGRDCKAAHKVASIV
jgi:hypothetical protein